MVNYKPASLLLRQTRTGSLFNNTLWSRRFSTMNNRLFNNNNSEAQHEVQHRQEQTRARPLPPQEHVPGRIRRRKGQKVMTKKRLQEKEERRLRRPSREQAAEFAKERRRRRDLFTFPGKDIEDGERIWRLVGSVVVERLPVVHPEEPEEFRRYRELSERDEEIRESRHDAPLIDVVLTTKQLKEKEKALQEEKERKAKEEEAERRLKEEIEEEKRRKGLLNKEGEGEEETNAEGEDILSMGIGNLNDDEEEELDEIDLKIRENPRLTRADFTNNFKTPLRNLSRTVYLIIKKDGKWQFPSTGLKPDQTMRNVAEVALSNVGGKRLKATFISNAPDGCYKRLMDEEQSKDSQWDAEKTFYFGAIYQSGNVVTSNECEDFAWVDREEMGEYLSTEEKEFFQIMLRE